MHQVVHTGQREGAQLRRQDVHRHVARRMLQFRASQRAGSSALIVLPNVQRQLRCIATATRRRWPSRYTSWRALAPPLRKPSRLIGSASRFSATVSSTASRSSSVRPAPHAAADSTAAARRQSCLATIRRRLSCAGNQRVVPLDLLGHLLALCLPFCVRQFWANGLADGAAQLHAAVARRRCWRGRPWATSAHHDRLAAVCLPAGQRSTPADLLLAAILAQQLVAVAAAAASCSATGCVPGCRRSARRHFSCCRAVARCTSLGRAVERQRLQASEVVARDRAGLLLLPPGSPNACRRWRGLTRGHGFGDARRRHDSASRGWALAQAGQTMSKSPAGPWMR